MYSRFATSFAQETARLMPTQTSIGTTIPHFSNLSAKSLFTQEACVNALRLTTTAQSPKMRLIANRGIPLYHPHSSRVRADKPMLNASLSDERLADAVSDLFASIFTKTGLSSAMRDLCKGLTC